MIYFGTQFMRQFLTAFLALSMAASALAAPIKILLVADSPEGGESCRALLDRPGVQVKAATELDDAALANADVLLFHGGAFQPLAATHREALEAFARRGGGIVALRGAIAFGEAPWWKTLLGGAWTAESRKFANKLMLFTLTDAHPITRAASPFDLDDDTIYDLETDPAINVLASAFTPKITGKRADQRAGQNGDRANVYDLQPQMWTYEAPDHHRAFVLLQGEPETLKHPSIRSFVLRGIAWAARRDNVDELCSAEDMATLRYPKNGAQTAADTVRSFELQPGFKASVVASEPLITKPVAMQWDEQGRLWIAETPEYPNGRRPLVAEPWKETGVLVPGKYDRPARDRISILSAPDANGEFTRKTVFHEGLELVTGFCLYGDGVIAVAQPDIVFIHGEGAAQKVERLYTGFTPGDTHFVANHFIVAPDGWIYANTGSGPDAVSVPHPEVKARLSSGVFRFKPDGSAIEQVSSKGGNAFGLDITSDGEIFFGQATSGNPVQHVVLPESILAKGKTGNAISAESVIKQRKVIRPDMPDRAPFMQIDVVGGYSSACASTVYEAGAWPPEWSGGVFCTEPILDIIHHEKLVPAGETFTGEMVPPDKEWLRARDFRFLPHYLELGPEGAKYVLDFYCPIVAHSDTRGPLHSKAGASVRPDRDHYFGRIYRIQYDQAKKLEIPDLSKADVATLVQAFTHPNKLTRFTAHRSLMSRPDAATAVPALKTMADSEKFGPARILALWALERLGRLEPETLQAALKSGDAGVRKSALLVAEAMGEKNSVEIAGLLNDTDARVRLTALRAMASSPITPAGAESLLAILPKLNDDWSRSAAAAAASSNAGAVLEAALSSRLESSPALLNLATSLSKSLADRQDGDALAKVAIAASRAAPASAELVTAILEAAGDKIPSGAPSSAALNDALKVLVSSKDQSLAAGALPFVVAWQSNDELRKIAAGRIADLLTLVGDAQKPDSLRATAARALLRARKADDRIEPAIVALLKTPLSDTLALDLIAALASTGDLTLGKPLTATLASLAPLGQAALFDALTTRAEWANALLDSLQAGELKPALLGPARLSKLRLHPDRAIAARAVKVIGEIGGGTNPAKDEIIAALAPQDRQQAGRRREREGDLCRHLRSLPQAQWRRQRSRAGSRWHRRPPDPRPAHAHYRPEPRGG